MREAEAAVARCAMALAIDHCMASAQEIDQLSAELHRRRADLYSLTAAITSQPRNMPYQAGLYLPPLVGRALGAIDSRVDVRFAEKLKALSTDPEGPL